MKALMQIALNSFCLPAGVILASAACSGAYEDGDVVFDEDGTVVEIDQTEQALIGLSEGRRGYGSFDCAPFDVRCGDPTGGPGSTHFGPDKQQHDKIRDNGGGTGKGKSQAEGKGESLLEKLFGLGGKCSTTKFSTDCQCETPTTHAQNNCRTAGGSPKYPNLLNPPAWKN